MKTVIASGPGYPPNVQGICPCCGVLVSIILRKSGLLWWHCGTLDCGYKKKFDRKKQRGAAVWEYALMLLVILGLAGGLYALAHALIQHFRHAADTIGALL
jgi:Flp pilus assembly pilin Flp